MFTSGLSIAWPYFIASIVSLELAIHAWTKPKNTTSSYFVLVMLTAAFWSLLSGLHLVVPDVETKIFITDLKFLFVTSLPVLWVLLAISYSGKSLRRRTIVSLFVFPAIVVGLIATNPMHQLVFVSTKPLVTEFFVSVSREYGPVFWVFTVYSYVLTTFGVFLFIHRMINSRGYLRIQAMIMTAGALVPFAFNAMYLSNPEAYYHLDYTPVSFSVSGLLFFIGLFRYRMLDLKPIAREEIIRSMADGVIVTDPNGYIVEINESVAKLRTGSSKSEVGMFVSDEFPFLADLWKSVKSGDRFTKEFEITGFGDDRWFVMSSKMVIVNGNDHQGYLIVLRDITERKIGELQLLEAKKRSDELSRLKSEFLASMSHDVRTPLAGIVGLADILVDECSGEQQEFAEMIRVSSDRLLHLLNSILSVAHLSSGTLDQHTELTDVALISQKVLAEYVTEAEEKNIELLISVPEQKIESELDRIHLSHALSHLLDHAMSLTKKGEIHFDLRKVQEQLIFRISDTGCGMDPEFVKSISQSLDALNLDEFGLKNGSGLGLRVAHRLIEQMGGKLDIFSVIGEGSTYCVPLPIVRPGSKRSERPPVRLSGHFEQTSPVETRES